MLTTSPGAPVEKINNNVEPHFPFHVLKDTRGNKGGQLDRN